MQASMMIDDVAAQGSRLRQQLVNGGGGGGDTTDGPLVTFSCSGFTPTEVQNDGTFTLRATARFQNNTDEEHQIAWEVVVNGNVVGQRRTDVPGGDTITDQIEESFSPAQDDTRLPTTGDVDVVVRQRFGLQQEDTCGTLTITSPPGEPSEPDEPTTGVDIGQVIRENPQIAVGIVGAILVFLLVG